MTEDQEKIVAFVMALAEAYNVHCKKMVLSDLVKATATFAGNVIMNLHDNVSGELDDEVIAVIEDEFCDTLAEFIERTIEMRNGGADANAAGNLATMKCRGGEA